jgi:hypothetical protein
MKLDIGNLHIQFWPYSSNIIHILYNVKTDYELYQTIQLLFKIFFGMVNIQLNAI